ncbi:MAG: DUF2461 domain-containing protein [Chloroflexota bacterium]
MPTTTESETFTGFRPEAIQFLADLAENNDRDWFTPRKSEYERLLKRPLAALCVALDEAFRARGIPLEADPAGSPFRIYRDVRFSKDKSPYKTNVAASFPWAEGGDADGPHGFGEGGDPGGYFHMGPGQVYVGGGMWHPPTPKLAAFRSAVSEDPKAVRRLLDAPGFVKTFGPLSGAKLKRVPPGFPPDHPEAELLKHKDLTFGRRLADRDVAGPQLVDVIADTLAAAVAVMRWLAAL